MQYWSVKYPCIFCKATTNTTHAEGCKYRGMYSATGSPLPPGRIPGV